MDIADRAQENMEIMDELRKKYQPQKRPMTRAMDYCLDCGERIDGLRLKLIPHAERCVDCQQDYERTINF